MLCVIKIIAEFGRQLFSEKNCAYPMMKKLFPFDLLTFSTYSKKLWLNI